MGYINKGDGWEKKDAGDAGSVPAEVKRAVDKLMREWEAFKADADRERIATKKSGSADVVLRDQVAKIGDALDRTKDDINTLFKKANRPVLTMPAAQAEAETKANLEFGAWGGESDETKAAAGRRAYRAAFDRLSRRGKDALEAGEIKALSSGSAPDGGYYIEPARSDQILQRLRETSAMREIASVITITSDRIKYPVDRDDVGYEWVGETTTRSETTTPQVGELEIPVHEISAKPKSTQNLLDDAGFDVESWLNGKLGDRFARAENTAFVSGNGTSRPRGFLTGTPVTTADASRSFGVLQYIGTGVSGDFAASNKADKLLDLIYAFNAGYRANLTWVMNKTTLGLIRKFKDGQGNYIYGPKITEKGLVDMVFEYPVKEFSDMPDLAANSYSVALGDFRRGYQIVDRQGIRQLRDAFTAKPYVLFYTTKRVGGGVTDSDAIKLLKFA